MEYLKFGPSEIESTKDIRPGWSRELWEWLMVMAGFSLGMWIFLGTAQLVAELMSRLLSPIG